MLLSGGRTPVESQPEWLQILTSSFLPTALRQLLAGDHLSRRRAGAVWRQFLMVAAIGLAFFVYSLRMFRKSIAVTK